MGKHILLTLLAVVCISLALKCNHIQQGVLQNNLCIKYEETADQILLQLCKNQDTPYCPPSLDSNSTCVAKPKTLQPIGLYCQSDEDCDNNGTCHFQICRGSSEGSNCKDSNSCDIGLACIENTTKQEMTCQKQKAQNKDCDNEYQCLNNLGCGDNKCIPYFSVQVGQNITNVPCQDSYSELCESFTCETVTEPQGLKCIDSFRSSTQQPILANDSSDCQGSSTSGDTYNASVTCGYEYEGNVYCSAHSGDDVSLAYINQWKKVNDIDQGLCHTQQRRNPSCWAIRTLTPIKMDSNNLLEILIYTDRKYDLLHFPTMNLSEDITQEIYFPELYNARTQNLNYFISDTSEFQCLAFQDTQSLPQNQCTQIGDYDGVMFNQKCSESQSCNTQTGICEANLKYPGMFCIENEECISYNCTDELCKGKGETKNCSFNKECDVGLYCEDNACTKQKQINEQCKETTDCQNNLACNGTHCLDVASQAKGEKCLEDITDMPHISFSCQSLH